MRSQIPQPENFIKQNNIDLEKLKMYIGRDHKQI